MFGHDPFYFETMRKMTFIFGTLFNDIFIRRFDSSGSEVKRIKVPLAYSAKEKFIVRLRQDPTLETDVAMTLPRLGFHNTAIDYDSSRQCNPTHKHYYGSTTTQKTQYRPVPFNINYELYIFARNETDGAQILEQILPFFCPAHTISANTLPALNLKDDVPIVLTGVTPEEVYEGDFTERRALIWTLSFTIKSYFYKPIVEQGLITQTQIDLLVPPTDLDGDGNTEVTDAEVLVTPRSVRILTVPDPIDAGPDDDYGFNQTITFYNDGKKYDPVLDRDVLLGNDEISLTLQTITLTGNAPEFTSTG